VAERPRIEPSDEPEGFARSLRAPKRTWLRGVEAATGWCAVGGGTAVSLVLVGYVTQFEAWMPSEGWWRLAVEALTFAFATGGGCGAGIGALVLGLGRSEARRWHAIGGLGAVPAAAAGGAFGADHFGSLPLPYIGLGAIFAAIAVGVAVAGVGLARTACPGLGFRLAGFHALWPSALLALVLGAGASFAPAHVDVELEVMRSYADALGLAVLGALGGGLVGALGGMALGTTMVAAARTAQ
jgi:hypothetical protein